LGPNPKSPIPNPQSPIPIEGNLLFLFFSNNNKKNKLKFIYSYNGRF